MGQSPEEKEFLKTDFDELRAEVRKKYEKQSVILKKDLKDNFKLINQNEEYKKGKNLTRLLDKIMALKIRDIFPRGVGSVKQYLDALMKNQSLIKVPGWKGDKIKAFFEMIRERAPYYFSKNIEKQWEKKDELPGKK